MIRSRNSASADAVSRPAASRCRGRASGRSVSRSGQEPDDAKRATATAVAGRAAGFPTSTAAPGQIDRMAFSARTATCRLATISETSSPRRRTTFSSIAGQPTRQVSRPRRCRGWSARTSSTASSGSGSRPGGGEIVRRTASASEASSYARCRAFRISGGPTLAAPYAAITAAAGCTTTLRSGSGSGNSGSVTALLPLRPRSPGRERGGGPAGPSRTVRGVVPRVAAGHVLTLADDVALGNPKTVQDSVYLIRLAEWRDFTIRPGCGRGHAKCQVRPEAPLRALRTFHTAPRPTPSR